MRLFILTVAVLCLAPFSAEASNTPQFLETRLAPLILPHAQHAGQQRSSYLESQLSDPVAPTFEAVDYNSPEESKIIESQIDSLLFGLNSYIAPEFDVYGHEIRRYMVRTIEPSQMNNPAEVLAQYRNVRRAGIIAEQWQQDMSAKLEKISVDIEASGSMARMRSKLTYNQNIIDQFFKDLNAWVSANQDAVEFYFRNQGEFEVVYPLYYFMNFGDKEEFMQIYIDREKALAEMQKYLPFAKMIY